MDNIKKQKELMVQWAVYYARELGLAVHPLRPDKTPRLLSWQEKASKDPGVIRSWWDKWPDALIGIATGQISGGVCVIDMDNDELAGKEGYQNLKEWCRQYGEFPDSWQSITGRGGYHYFFKATEPIKNRIGIIEDVDVRGDGGYIVAPPSIHPNGNCYEWEYAPDEFEITEMTDTIRFFLQTGSDAPQGHFVAPEIVPQGERNGIMFKFACMMQAKGASDDAVYAATFAENESKCSPPLGEGELRKIVESALKYDKGKPIYINSEGIATQGQREPIFSTDRQGRILKTWDNIREAIEFDEELYGSIKFNVLSNNIYVFGELPWEKTDTYRPWKNTDDASLKTYLEKRYAFNSAEKIMDALSIVAERNKFNPIVDELEMIYNSYGECNGAIRKLLPEYMGVKDNEYNYEVLKLYMLGAISRAFHPGCKFDYSIILYGAQGFGKSEFLRHLAIRSDWFNDNFNTFDGDKAIEKLSGMWLVEMAELKALKSAKDSESFKSFLTSRVDTYRVPYSRRAEQRPRMCVFAGTTNNKNVFVDKTGNRRFLPIECRKGFEIKNLFGDQNQVMEDFKKAWSEAMHLFINANRKPALILPSGVQAEAERMQEEFSEEDWRVGAIQNWLDNSDITKICIPMVIEHALKMDYTRERKSFLREVRDILDNEITGFHRAENKDKGRMRFGKYGSQLAFIRDLE